MTNVSNRLIIVSNRLPINIDLSYGEITVIPSVGGLATGMKSIYKKHDSLWIGWPGIASDELGDKEKNQIVSLLAKEKCAAVHLSAKEIEDYYYGFTNRTIWPLFHYFLQYANFDQPQWEAYVAVNKKFAELIVSRAVSGDYIWVHDYHLFLLPQMIREKLPDVSIGFFLHIPFPSYEIFRTLPWREEILKGMLGSDLIGFHTYDYERHFLSCVRRLIGHEIEMNRMTVESRYVRADVFPMGIDYDKFSSTARDVVRAKGENRSKMQLEIDSYATLCPGCKLILSIDRLDYTKGIPNRLKAFELFLEKNPQYHQRVSLIMLTVPSRTNVFSYQQLKSEIDELVGRINGHYRTITWTPIWYFYRSMPFEDLVALYSSAHIALLTPLRDGMNLVAKEYVASRTEQDGVLILSEMTGASKEMGEAVIINPNNIEQTAAAIVAAIEMEISEQKASIMTIQRRLQRYNVSRWAEDFISSLTNASSDSISFSSRLMNQDLRHKIVTQFRNSRKRVVFLDYDGTLIGFFNKPEDASPDAELFKLLMKISELPSTDLVISTGRNRESIKSWFDGIRLSLITEHGLWTRRVDGEWEIPREFNTDWKASIRQLMEFYVDRTPGTFIEEKDYSLVWHYRKTDPEMGALRARELREELMGLVLSDKNLEIMEGSRVLEVKVNGYNKGIAAERFIFQNDYDFIMAIGDDVTDEYMFDHLPGEAITIKVGISPSKAHFRLKNPADVRNLLFQFL